MCGVTAAASHRKRKCRADRRRQRQLAPHPVPAVLKNYWLAGPVIRCLIPMAQSSDRVINRSRRNLSFRTHRRHHPLHPPFHHRRHRALRRTKKHRKRLFPRERLPHDLLMSRRAIFRPHHSLPGPIVPHPHPMRRRLTLPIRNLRSIIQPLHKY